MNKLYICRPKNEPLNKDLINKESDEFTVMSSVQMQLGLSFWYMYYLPLTYFLPKKLLRGYKYLYLLIYSVLFSGEAKGARELVGFEQFLIWPNMTDCNLGFSSKLLRRV